VCCRDFTAVRERGDVTVVQAGAPISELEIAARTESERLKEEEENRHFLTVPRRPEWDKTTTAEELALKERESFLAWRRNLNLFVSFVQD